MNNSSFIHPYTIYDWKFYGYNPKNFELYNYICAYNPKAIKMINRELHIEKVQHKHIADFLLEKL